MDQTLLYLLWATVSCLLICRVSGSDEDLMDFDFTDLKEIDWNYETENSKELMTKGTTEKNIITFDDDSDLLEENQLHPFDWREKVLRTALSKALMNKAVRQKFIEVMPILRVLSKQQRLALSALITAQINAKKGNELKLAQVRLMFGDDKSLILPIVFDIANLVRNSAKNYIQFDYNLADFGDFSKATKSYERRNLKLSPAELEQEEHNEDIGTLPAAAQVAHQLGLDGLEEFMSEELLDPKEINEELEVLKVEGQNATDLHDANLEGDLEQAQEEDDDITYPLDINIQLQKDVPTLMLLKHNRTLEAANERHHKQPTSFAYAVTTAKAPARRVRRSARDSREFVHKLVRSVSFSLNEDDLQRSNAGRALKLNTTAFASPKENTFRTAVDSSSVATTTSSSSTTVTTKAPIIITPETLPQETYDSYQLVEDLAFAGLNGSDIFPEDNENADNDLISEAKSEPDDEILPTPEELISGPRYRLNGNKLAKISNGKRKRVQTRARPKKGAPGNGVLPPKKCERFTASMCIKTDDYPM